MCRLKEVGARAAQKRWKTIEAERTGETENRVQIVGGGKRKGDSKGRESQSKNESEEKSSRGIRQWRETHGPREASAPTKTAPLFERSTSSKTIVAR